MDNQISALSIGDARNQPLYALSPVITVAASGEATGAPGLQWARVNGTELSLRFDAAFDETPAPAAAAFTVSVAGAARTVSGCR